MEPAPTCSRPCSPSSATLFYVFVYTLWLKRTSTQNIVIGGAAGAVPVLVGWAAVQDSLGWTPVILFVVMFLWTPPHFWALAIRYADDYRAASVPMLPAVATPEVTARKMIAYTAVMVGVHARPGRRWPTSAGCISVAAVVLGALFLGGTICARPQSHAAALDARLRLQHHLRHAAVRCADARRAAPLLSGARPGRADFGPLRRLWVMSHPTDLEPSAPGGRAGRLANNRAKSSRL